MSIDKTLTALAEAMARQAAAQERIADALEALKPAATNVTVNAVRETLKENLKVAGEALDAVKRGDAQSGETTAGDGAAQDPAKTTAASQGAGTAQEQADAASATGQAGSTATRTSDPAPAQQETASADEIDAAAAPEKKASVSVDQARAALRAFSQKEGTPAALELLNSLNAKSISDLDADGRAALMERIGGAA